jgi:hypothetical protein
VGSNIIRGEKINKIINKMLESKSEPTLTADPWTLYLYAMRSPATKEN